MVRGRALTTKSGTGVPRARGSWRTLNNSGPNRNVPLMFSHLSRWQRKWFRRAGKLILRHDRSANVSKRNRFWQSIANIFRRALMSHMWWSGKTQMFFSVARMFSLALNCYKWKLMFNLLTIIHHTCINMSQISESRFILGVWESLEGDGFSWHH